MTEKSPLERAIDIIGSQRRVGLACGKTQSHVWNWVHRDKKIPAEHVIAVSRATAFRVTPHELRPDIFAHEHDGLPPEHAEAS